MPDPGFVVRGFTLGHQKVSVDVDFCHRRLEGWTDITIIPTTEALTSASFHCYQSEITNVEVEGEGASWNHVDGLQSLALPEESGVHQHFQLRQKYASLNRSVNRCDLVIKFPDSVTVKTQLDPQAQATHTIVTNGIDRDRDSPAPEDHDTLGANSPGAPGPPTLASVQYQAITIKIYFKLENPVMGVRFTNVHGSKTAYPHIYTINNPIPCSTSMWLPCLDGVWERCTWEFAITVPKTIGDIRRRKSLSNGVSRMNGHLEHGATDDVDSYANTEILVVCSGDLIDEITHFEDPSRKTISFAQATPTGASHIGFTAGPFKKVNLTDFRESEEDDAMGASAVDVFGYHLPGRENDMKNTCFFIYKAMDYYVREFGSYPFTSYKLCFVEDMDIDAVSTASMTMVSSRLLFRSDLIDPIYPVTRELSFLLASQWIGVNTVPRSWSDLWLILGLAYYITGLFLRKLMGNNDQRFRLKQDAVKVTEQDVGRPPISSRDIELPIDPVDLEFIVLKAPIVLHILEKRLTKAGSNLGLLRVIPKLFLQSMSGDLVNGVLSTQYFLRQCEKVSHVKLDAFANQWIYGYGFPQFSIVQRFNRKKMIIEMGIRQQQSQETLVRPLSEDTLVDDGNKLNLAKNYSMVSAAFTGPITIRIHEADGTPYEHVVEIKEQFTKLDIPYNTKYRRIRRQRSKLPMGQEGNNMFEDTQAEPDYTLHSLGDVLQTDQDQIDWKLSDWTKEDEDKMASEAFEWIRIDAEFEWICTMTVGQPDYMFVSQLQQDRDVVAQYEALQYFSSVKESHLVSTILCRTLMDRRYYYGIRQLAAAALSRCAVSELDFIGQWHLMRSFQSMYCFPNSIIPKENDFTDIAACFVKCALTRALAEIRDKAGVSLPVVKTVLIDNLRYNDNSNNQFSDCHYVATLIESMTSALIRKSKAATDSNLDNSESKPFVGSALAEIERTQRMDRWLPSFQNVVSIAALVAKERLMRYQLIPIEFRELLEMSREGNNVLVRRQAFDCMLKLSALRHPPLVKYIFYTIERDPSAFLTRSIARSLKCGVGAVALNGRHFQVVPSTDIMVVEEDTAAADEQRKDQRSRTSVAGAIAAVRAELGNDEQLKESIWAVANNWKIDILTRRHLLDICRTLYQGKQTRILKFKLPSMRSRLMATHLGNCQIVIKKDRPYEKLLKREAKKVPKIKLKLGGLGGRESPAAL